jgi:hypothetical protein
MSSSLRQQKMAANLRPISLYCYIYRSLFVRHLLKGFFARCSNITSDLCSQTSTSYRMVWSLYSNKSPATPILVHYSAVDLTKLLVVLFGRAVRVALSRPDG